jgi:plastocyanin
MTPLAGTVGLQLPVQVAFLSAARRVAWSADEKGGEEPEAKPITVEMKSISYDPKKVEVPVGGSVVWTKKAFSKHTATPDDEGKDVRHWGEIKPNESSSAVKFDKEGEFNYHCKIHGKTMSGVVVVKAAGAN